MSRDRKERWKDPQEWWLVVKNVSSLSIRGSLSAFRNSGYQVAEPCSRRSSTPSTVGRSSGLGTQRCSSIPHRSSVNHAASGPCGLSHNVCLGKRHVRRKCSQRHPKSYPLQVSMYHHLAVHINQPSSDVFELLGVILSATGTIYSRNKTIKA